MPIYHNWVEARSGGARAQSVCHYHDLVQDLADNAKAKGAVSDADMATLTQEIEPEGFTRFGNFMEEQDWPAYAAMMKAWVLGSKAYTTEFLRMTEEDSLVFLELCEIHAEGAIRSVSIYEFNPAGKICRLHIYLQMPMPGQGGTQ